MKKLLISFALSASLAAAASPATAPMRSTGGYLGHRFIIGGELNVSPFYTSLQDFYTKYNFQYGGNLSIITGRYSQIGLSYNRWSLGNNQVFEGNFVSSDRVEGTQYGLTWRQFRKKRGGLAPIGKFYDISLGYSQNKFIAGKDNPDVLYGNAAWLPVSSDMITASIGFGAQHVFWDHLVTSTGVRFGAPIFQVNQKNGQHYGDFIYNRMLYKDCFSVFFGVGLLI